MACKNLRCDSEPSEVIFDKSMELLALQKHAMLPSRKMEKMLEIVNCRQELESRNNTLVRNIPNTLNFYVRRYLMSR